MKAGLGGPPLSFSVCLSVLLQVLPSPVVCVRPGLPDPGPGRGLGLPHGHRLLGEEVRLHVGRGQERHEGDAGSPGEKIFQEKIFLF